MIGGKTIQRTICILDKVLGKILGKILDKIVVITHICEHQHRLNELGIAVGDKVYHLGEDYYKTLTPRPVVFRIKLLFQE